MKRIVVLAIFGLVWSAVADEPARSSAMPASGPAKLEKAGEDATNGTVITSTQLSFDQQKRQALFEGNVVVTDREVKILSDRLNVFFTEDNKVDRIEAEGHVSIIRNDVKATGEKATYDMKDGRMQLTGNPRIQRDQDMLTGETVTMWRDSKRILCEPNAKLIISSDQEMNRSFK
ncbi:MAG: LptA/OstA family protein [Kiritimatiellia bacterium]|jgi:lipopolysaccharide export system protein LptA